MRAPLAAALMLLAAALPSLGGPARVRLRLADGSELEGELLRHREDEYRVRPAGGEERAVPARDVRGVELLEEDATRVDFTGNGRPLGEMAEDLAAFVGRTVVVPASRREAPIGATIKNVTWRQALEVIAHQGECEVLLEGATLRLRPLVTLQARELPAQAALVRVCAAAEERLEVAREVEGPLTLGLERVPIAIALEALGWALAVEVDASTVPWKAGRLAQRPALEPFHGPRWGLDPALPAGHPVTLRLEGRPLQEVCERIMAASGAQIVVDMDVPALSVSLDVQDTTWREALAQVARQAGCKLETIGGLALVTKPRGVVRAAQAPAAGVFALLCFQLGKGWVLAPEVRGLVSFEQHGVQAREAIHRVAHPLGWRVVLVRQAVFAVGGAALDPRPAPEAVLPPGKALELGGRTFFPPPRLQALAIGLAPGCDRVLIDGQLYAEGEEVRGKDGAGRGLRVERLGADGVDYVVGEARTRIALGR